MIDRHTDGGSQLLWKVMIDLRTVNKVCTVCVYIMQRYLGCGSDSAELSLEDQTAAFCQSEHPVGADLHRPDQQMDNLRKFHSHSILVPHCNKIISHELKKYNLPL